jgi:hypothetical protein
MHAVEVLQKCLPSVFSRMHVYRATALLCAVRALIASRRLILIELARAWPGAERVRAPLKRIDRLLANPYLRQEREIIYAAMARWLIRHARPIIVIDWSELRDDNRWHVLRAGIPVGSRTLTVLECVYPESMLGSPRAEKAFLKKLKSLLPSHIKPILVTDAGFRTPWFKSVAKLGWHYVGRLRHRTLIKLHPDDPWFDNRNLYAQANRQAQRFSNVTLVADNPWVSDLVLYQRPKRGRYCLTRRGARSQSRRAVKAEVREREPWLLVVSPELDAFSAQQIVKVYGKRMQIEESFRDLKCARFGCAFDHSQTRHPERLMILLLIHALATFVAWLMTISIAATDEAMLGGITTPRARRHYSLLRIGWEALRRNHFPNACSILRHTVRLPATHLTQALAATT